MNICKKREPSLVSYNRHVISAVPGLAKAGFSVPAVGYRAYRYDRGAYIFRAQMCFIVAVLVLVSVEVPKFSTEQKELQFLSPSCFLFTVHLLTQWLKSIKK